MFHTEYAFLSVINISLNKWLLCKRNVCFKDSHRLSLEMNTYYDVNPCPCVLKEKM